MPLLCLRPLLGANFVIVIKCHFMALSVNFVFRQITLFYGKKIGKKLAKSCQKFDKNFAEIGQKVSKKLPKNCNHLSQSYFNKVKVWKGGWGVKK
jgi:hypothetical protein